MFLRYQCSKVCEAFLSFLILLLIRALMWWRLANIQFANFKIDFLGNEWEYRQSRTRVCSLTPTDWGCAVCSEVIMNQFVWNNKYIPSEGKSLYHAFLHNTCRISKVGDLVSKDNTFLGSEKVVNAKLTPSQYFLLMGVVSAIPNEWCSTIKGKSVHVDLHPLTEDFFQVPIKGELFDLLSVSSKTFYREFHSHKEIPPNAQAKFKEEYPSLSIDWKEIDSLAFNVTLNTNLRVFQYKLLDRIVFMNDKLFKFKLVDSLSCTFCKINEESLEHLLFFCKITEFFWKEVLSWLVILKSRNSRFFTCRCFVW